MKNKNSGLACKLIQTQLTNKHFKILKKSFLCEKLINIELISYLFPDFRSCTTDNSTIVVKGKNSLICENKAIYTLYIQNLEFFGVNLNLFLASSKY